MSSHFNEANWADMTVFEQMGNIGSEVGRAIKAKRNGDDVAMTGAFKRGLDLIDYTAELWAKSKPWRTRELLRARELFAETITTDHEDPGIENYFFQFALAARRDK